MVNTNKNAHQRRHSTGLRIHLQTLQNEITNRHVVLHSFIEDLITLLETYVYTLLKDQQQRTQHNSTACIQDYNSLVVFIIHNIARLLPNSTDTFNDVVATTDTVGQENNDTLITLQEVISFLKSIELTNQLGILCLYCLNEKLHLLPTYTTLLNEIIHINIYIRTQSRTSSTKIQTTILTHLDIASVLASSYPYNNNSNNIHPVIYQLLEIPLLYDFYIELKGEENSTTSRIASAQRISDHTTPFSLVSRDKEIFPVLNAHYASNKQEMLNNYLKFFHYGAILLLRKRPPCLNRARKFFEIVDKFGHTDNDDQLTFVITLCQTLLFTQYLCKNVLPNKSYRDQAIPMCLNLKSSGLTSDIIKKLQTLATNLQHNKLQLVEKSLPELTDLPMTVHDQDLVVTCNLIREVLPLLTLRNVATTTSRLQTVALYKELNISAKADFDSIMQMCNSGAMDEICPIRIQLSQDFSYIELQFIDEYHSLFSFEELQKRRQDIKANLSHVLHEVRSLTHEVSCSLTKLELEENQNPQPMIDE